MRLHNAVLAAVICAVALVGCKQSAKSQSDKLVQTRITMEKKMPGAKLGVVSATLPENDLLAVSQVDVTQFSVGDTVVLMDTDQKIIGAGTVVAKTDNSLHVKYDVTAKGRAPKVGDIAVKPQQ